MTNDDASQPLPDRSTGERDTAPTVSIEQSPTSPSLLVRAGYFLLVGWWASGIWLAIAWLFIVTIIGAPIGIKMINLVPKIVSLKERPLQTTILENDDGSVSITQGPSAQHPLLLRAAYFVLIGWWASAIWLAIAWLFSITIVGLPVAVWMYDRLPFVVSLYRY